MPRSFVRTSLIALLAIASGTLLGAARGAEGRDDAPADVVVRYGLEGFMQPIGIHHGFHVGRVLPGSNAEKDGLQKHDVIIKMDEEPLRGLEHFREELKDARDNDEKFKMVVMKEGSLLHHHRTGRFRK